eukprot:CAMPEP_0175818898 /NCGR_PEP_ID=MMETSP0107_2-20121207/7788_1 /TAXON_ID=195067 ORGANISM="Goniomonas pacifica, Strain CCMP1869" /NCGR_SAMPLE_ID=MMETSP0107_2 /ASSEMBLY_ACC=CAM_ASM_000203 /LENGTH=53 /DNA_ID=CAMNT_0017131123 /DNA_START=917 /DNA_END=1075 /DNA_ORIENTATION=+
MTVDAARVVVVSTWHRKGRGVQRGTDEPIRVAEAGARASSDEWDLHSLHHILR